MIRPFTLICMLLACGSGLYLYQTKHRVQLLDRDIAQTVQATIAARDRAGVLRTEWTLLNDLERLRALADQHLQLRPVAPGQFTTLAELANRLPPPRVPEPEPAATSVLQSEAAPAVEAQPEPEVAELPTPPVPPPAPRAPQPQVQLASVQIPPPKLAAKAAPEAALIRAAERRQLADVAPRPGPAPAPRPVATIASAPMAAPVYSAPQASSLGMASRTMLPPPVPVSAYQYTSPN